MKLSTQSFPHAPRGWSVEIAESIASAEKIKLDDDHWALISALQEYYSKIDQPRLRQVKDALEEKFHHKGGTRFLHQIVPSGPVATGCKLAGLEVPPGAIDKSFGSVA